MKKLVYLLIVPMMIAASSVLKAQDYAEGSLGLPGDNLNLFAVMKIFQESETLEGFERKLNDENSRINNLDLNGDNLIDYIRVIDQPDGDVHVIILQVAINVRENQDVAVFIVQREANNQVRIQLIGDEALYGKNYVIEPNYDVNGQYANETPNPGYTGRTTVVDGQTIVVNRVTTVEVAAWPLIRFMFLPSYVVWHSPWYWGYYPHWWNPWRPYYWHYYYGYHYHWYPHYYGYYHHHNHYDYPRYHSYYYGSRRAHSPYVANHIQSGHYKSTYSHPESRKEGSQLYTKTYANGNRRAAATPSVNQQTGRSTASQSAGNATTTTRRATTSRSSEVSASRPSAQQKSSNSTVRTETRRTTSDSRVTGAPEHKSTGTATSRSSAPRESSNSTVKTETRRTVSNSRTTGAPEHKSTGAATSRSSAPRESNGGKVKTETRKSSTESHAGSSSSSRRTSGNEQAKGSTKSSGSDKSAEHSRESTANRR